MWAFALSTIKYNDSIIGLLNSMLQSICLCLQMLYKVTDISTDPSIDVYEAIVRNGVPAIRKTIQLRS